MRLDEAARLSVLESKVDRIEADVAEIKKDVKLLLQHDSMISLIRWAIPGVALAVSIAAFMFK